jgi:hypothetical protein
MYQPSREMEDTMATNDVRARMIDRDGHPDANAMVQVGISLPENRTDTRFAVYLGDTFYRDRDSGAIYPANRIDWWIPSDMPR